MSARAKRSHWIAVVTGLIRRQGKVLLGQRPLSDNMAGLWEFPGGKIEIGESPEVALERELREELAIEAEIGALKFATTHNYGETGIVLLFYEVQYWKGELKPVHHMDLKWVEPEELRQIALPDANKKVIGHIISLLV